MKTTDFKTSEAADGAGPLKTDRVYREVVKDPKPTKGPGTPSSITHNPFKNLKVK